MAGYSGTPLVKKLGLKDGQRIRFIQPPEEFDLWLGSLPEVKQVNRKPYDVVVLFVNRVSLLEEWLLKLRNEISQSGMIWVAWYKKSSKKPSEIAEDLIRDTAIPLGLVDVKVCAISEEWSGLKLVIRVSERRQ